MKKYNTPVFEIQRFERENIITASSQDKTAKELVMEQLNGYSPASITELTAGGASGNAVTQNW